MIQFLADRDIAGLIQDERPCIVVGVEASWAGECGVGDDPGVVVAVAAANTPTIHAFNPHSQAPPSTGLPSMAD